MQPSIIEGPKVQNKPGDEEPQSQDENPVRFFCGDRAELIHFVAVPCRGPENVWDRSWILENNDVDLQRSEEHFKTETSR